MTPRRALLSVTDKTGLEEFARGLVALGFELLSTGGTASALRWAGLPVTDVGEITGVPEMLDGRVKTLHPAVHGGLLADLRKPTHVAALAEVGIVPISVVAVNLYAFEAKIRGEHEFDQAVESIDVGGPTMVRAAAKNHASVAIAVEPEDYPRLLASLQAGDDDLELRRGLAAKAFRHTAYYDSVIARYLTAEVKEDPFTETLTLGFRRRQTFRYGENPHQSAAFYAVPVGASGIGAYRQLWGKELSYNNLLDSDGAWNLVGDLAPGSVAIIKHSNPCGAASVGDLAASYLAAREGDPISAFGGIAAFHGTVDRAAAEAMTGKGNFLEVVIAQGFTDEAREIFANRSGWGQDVRLLEAPLPERSTALTGRTVSGGILIQTADISDEPVTAWTVPTQRKPSEEESQALDLMWRVVRHVKSNAIVVGSSDRLLGVGAGQMNRVQSVRLALEGAGEGSQGAVLASDAFFPFPDSITAAAEAGIAAIVQPGGSKKDADVVAEADRRGIAMCLTGARHFRH